MESYVLRVAVVGEESGAPVLRGEIQLIRRNQARVFTSARDLIGIIEADLRLGGDRTGDTDRPEAQEPGPQGPGVEAPMPEPK